MQTNDGIVTIDEGGGLREPLVKSRPIVSRFWLKGGQYRVTIPGEGWVHTTLDQCQIGEASKPATGRRLGPVGTMSFSLKQGFYKFVLLGPVDSQPKSAEIIRVTEP